VRNALLIALAVGGISAPATAETVCLKYGSCIDLAPMTCVATPESSFVRGACYDDANSYMVIHLNATWYQYCGLDRQTWGGLIDADSKGRFYNRNIKGNFDCRVTPPPRY
jgi:hypothetical protein